MLDIAFLSHPSFDRPIVYSYRTGVLRPAIEAAVAQLAQEKGLMRAEMSPRELETHLLSETLFPSYRITDWPTVQPPKLRPVMRSVIGGLATTAVRELVVIVEAGTAFDRAARSAVSESWLLVEEQDVRPENVDGVLEYLSQGSKYKAGQNPRTLAGFDEYFKELICAHGSLELPPFLQFFNKATLLGCQTGSPDFRPPAIAVESVVRSLVLAPARHLIASPGVGPAADVMRGFCVKHKNGWSRGRLLAELYRVSQVLLEDAIDGARHLQRNAMLFLSTLIAWDRALRGSDGRERSFRRQDNAFLVELDGFVDDYIERCRSTVVDPLTGHWAEVGRILERESSKRARGGVPFEKAVASLHQLLLQRSAIKTLELWLAQLSSLVGLAMERRASLIGAPS